MIRLSHLCTPASLLLVALVGCSGGGGNTGSVAGTGGQFLVLRSDPTNGGRIFLNESIKIDFSTTVDLTTADLSSMSFTVFDLQGNPKQEQPSGTFTLGTASDDDVIGRRLEFAPHFPTNDTYDDGGFRPGRRYVVSIAGGDARNGTILKDTRGKSLPSSVSFQFTTADGTTARELFRDTRNGGPKRVGFSVSPIANDRVSLSLLGQTQVEARLVFDQPLNPASANLPVGLDPNPIKRSINKRGRVFLEYDDAEASKGKNTWVPAAVDLEKNTLEGCTLVIRPFGVLPNNALVRVIVEPTVEDMSGESNIGDATYNRVFATFQTKSAYEPAFDAIVESFDTDASIDREAPFVDPRAEIRSGFLRANFEFEGAASALEYEPTTREIVLNTDFTQIIPKASPPINVAGGVFTFRNVKIPAGVIVRGTGTRPMVWYVTENFEVQGELSLSGGDGGEVHTLNSANFPTPGGVGACGGGNGGRASHIQPGPTYPASEAGFGPGQTPNGGGGGGFTGCQSGCGRGSGGGGGSMATQGDPWFKAKKGSGSSFIQQIGVGGYGCTGGSGSSTRSLQGGAAGRMVFTDSRTDNNFWGSAVNIFRQVRIAGELATPSGGAGGGGGGNLSSTSTCSTVNPSWINDNKGGGGGAGGGVLIVKALGSIIIGPQALVRCNGGNGGGGEQAASNNQGAGGGGGAGGMIVLMAGRNIQIHAHGETYANNDYTYAISADGGISTQGSFTSVLIPSKYPPPGSGATWDGSPTGGMGGMGVVQLMTPAGTTDADGTGTVLDENIIVYKNGTPAPPAEKKRYLAWRGFPNAAGVLVDDKGTPTNIGDAEGDIRPTPILAPAAFGAKSRARSKWIDTGASIRRELSAADGQPRGVVKTIVNGTAFGAGPVFSFAGTSTGSGYADYGQAAEGVEMRFPIPTDLQAVMPAEIASTATDASSEGHAVYEVELAQPVLGALADRYSQHRCELSNAAGTKLAEYRILSHDQKTLRLSTDGVAFPAGATRVMIRAKFFDLITNKSAGFGGSKLVGGSYVPLTNVQFGFAFHKDPSQAKESGADPLRYPSTVGQYAFDLADPLALAAMKDKPFVQWELLFNTLFAENEKNKDPFRSLEPGLPRPEVHSLVIPYRF